jgi:transcription initiation factor TFIIIB Brf1 subunit/transcription initiation factor TFIIB
MLKNTKSIYKNMAEEKCPDCHGKIVKTKDEKYCRECGLVIEEEP